MTRLQNSFAADAPAPEKRLRQAMALRAEAERLLCSAVEGAADALPRFDAQRYRAIAAALRSVAASLETSSIIAMLIDGAPPRGTLPENVLTPPEFLREFPPAGAPSPRPQHAPSLREDARSRQGAAWSRHAAQLLREERADAALAVELGDAMERVLYDSRLDDAERLGYLMRSYFENRRRHLVWAQEALSARAGAGACSSVAREAVAATEAFTAELRRLTDPC